MSYIAPRFMTNSTPAEIERAISEAEATRDRYERKASVLRGLLHTRHDQISAGTWPPMPYKPLTATELTVAQADVDHLNAEFPDEPQDTNGWPGDEHAEPGTRGWTV